MAEVARPLVILTGMSGAGKSTALRCFDDLGYFCLDNLPPTLIGAFLKLYDQAPRSHAGVAVVSDIRSGELFEHFAEAIAQLKEEGLLFNLVFVDCADDILVHRFNATRRRPPLGLHMGMTEALAAERSRLEPVRELATTQIDTSHLTPEQLRQRIMGLFGQPGEGAKLAVTVLSFGYKNGIPVDADFVFDVRFLPNPYYVPELQELTGEDEAVRSYVQQGGVAEQFVEQASAVLETAFAGYPGVHKNTVLVAVGCTGGHHRSVCIASSISARLAALGYRPHIQHRDVRLPQ